MKGKLMIMVIVGLLCLFFLSSITEAAPGGLPECTNSLNTCTTNLGACTNNLNICTTSLGACTTGQAQAQTNIATCEANAQASLSACQANLATCQASTNTVKVRRYFLTGSRTYDGASALSACGEGFHMANLYEILDPSHLQYDTNNPLAYAPDEDLGQGPPTIVDGWIRTGYLANPGDPAKLDGNAGIANCSAWTSNSNSQWGTCVSFNPEWTVKLLTEVAPWLSAGAGPCNSLRQVWCVQD
jgi:hypothetical protein